MIQRVIIPIPTSSSHDTGTVVGGAALGMSKSSSSHESAIFCDARAPPSATKLNTQDCRLSASLTHASNYFLSSYTPRLGTDGMISHTTELAFARPQLSTASQILLYARCCQHQRLVSSELKAINTVRQIPTWYPFDLTKHRAT